MKPKHDPTVTAEEHQIDELATTRTVAVEVTPHRARGRLGKYLAELASKDDDLIVASLAIRVEDPPELPGYVVIEDEGEPN